MNNSSACTDFSSCSALGMVLITRVSLKKDESMGNEILDSVNLMGVFLPW